MTTDTLAPLACECCGSPETECECLGPRDTTAPDFYAIDRWEDDGGAHDLLAGLSPALRDLIRRHGDEYDGTAGR